MSSYPRTFNSRLLRAAPLVALLSAAACGGSSHHGGGAASLDTVRPAVSSTSPASGGTGAALNGKVAATFSEAMNRSTINGTTFKLNQATTVVDGTVAYADAGTTAIFTPNGALTASQVYTATITTGAQDRSGNAIAANHVWSFTAGTTTDTVRPTVTARNPDTGATAVAINRSVKATFSEAMDSSTITPARFTLTGPAGGVAGSVAYDAANAIATFRPSSNLSPTTQYTATLASGLADLAGNTLLADVAWSFTTGSAAAFGPEMVNLGSAGDFAVLSFNTVTNVDSVGTTVTGDLGIYPGSALTGFPPGVVNGATHLGDPQAKEAQDDLLAAYNDGAGRLNAATLPGNLGGLTFAPGLYTNASSVLLSGSGPGNNVTLDAQGDSTAVFIFQIGSTLTTAPGSQVILSGGAKAANIFWCVGTSATVDTTTIFKGNILAASAVTLNTGASLEGRAFGMNAAVSLDSNAVTKPAQ